MKNPYTPEEPIMVDINGESMTLESFKEKFDEYMMSQNVTIPANLEEEEQDLQKILRRPDHLETYQDRIERAAQFE